MTCKEVVERLSEYWSNELDERTRNEVSLHLQGCPSCQHEWAIFQTAMNALKSVTTPEPSPELLSRIQSAVMAKQSRKPVFVWRWQWAMATGAATIVIALVSVSFFSRVRERARISSPYPIVAEESAPLLPPPALKQPSPSSPTLPIPLLRSMPSPRERIKQPRSSVLAKRLEATEKQRTQKFSEAGKFLPQSPSEKLPVLSIPSGERLPEQSTKDIDIASPVEQTEPKLAELPIEPRMVPFRAEAKLSEPEKVSGTEFSGRTPSPQSPTGPHGPAAAMPTIGALKSQVAETQTPPAIGQHFPAIGQQYGGFGQFGGGFGQTLFTNPFGLRWAKFEPVVVGKVRLWELALSYENSQVVTIFVSPGEKVEVLNAQQPITGESKGLIIWRDKLPFSREVYIPILLRANEIGTRKLLTTLETADGKTFSWWCLFPATIREEQPKIRRLITLQVEQWTALDLFSHLAWETKAAFLLPEQVGYIKVNMPTKAVSLLEILALLERQTGMRWQRFGSTFSLTYPISTQIIPMMKQ